MKKMSLWQDINRDTSYQKLNKDIYVDILIIGGGITGISTAYHLKNSNLNIAVVEKNKIADGVSSKTTGKLTFLQNLIYTKLNNEYSFDVAKMYYESQIDAIKLVENIIKENNIDCDYTAQKSYLFGSTKEEVEKIKYEKELLEKMGVKTNDVKRLPVNIYNFYGISVANTAYFHPVKYINSLAKICSDSQVNIYENTNVIKIEKTSDEYICYANDAKIFAKKVVVACHYPFFIFPYIFPIKGYLERSYISATKVEKNKLVSGINTIKNTTSFRYHTDKVNNYLIYLNGSHNLAFKFNVKENFKEMLKSLEQLNLKPDYIWSNEDIITNDYLPYIGLIKENLYIATGYNTWGMTNGSIAGLIISDLILNKNNKYESLFNPKRVMPISSISSIFYDAFSSAKPLIENKVIKNKSFYSDNVIFTKKNGKNIAIYIDNDGNKHIVYNLCPHLKCSLIFNEEEKTWDCPCHSSRFDIDGNCIKGPSCYNISYKKNGE